MTRNKRRFQVEIMRGNKKKLKAKEDLAKDHIVPPSLVGSNEDLSLSLSLAKDLIFHSKNLVVSPLSIKVVLALMAAGSSGPSRDQILGYLNSDPHSLLNLLLSDSAGGPCFSVANGVWVDQTLTLKPSFKQIAQNDYMAACNHLDFQNKADKATKEVNRWASKTTNGLIKEILSSGSIGPLTRLIFANAIYFKAHWEEPFAASRTKPDRFFLLNGTSIQVPFMNNTPFNRRYVGAFDGFKVLRLPYKRGGGDNDNTFSMYFFLPDANNGLPLLIDKLSSDPGFIDRHVPHQKVKVGDCRIPKFKVNLGFEVSKFLKEKGVVLPFSGDGGLNEMVDDGVLHAFGIFQKAFIQVDEEGTEAAAVTWSVLCSMSAPKKVEEEKPIDFVADHPLMFVVREDVSGIIIFIGHLLNPLAHH